jgi:predicted transcriptional regulator of viral defense system
MRRDRQDLRRQLAALAAAQSGYFTAAQALEVGYSYQAQKYHSDRGNWQRVDRGLYHLPEWPGGQHEDLVRWSLWSRGKAVVSHESALAVYDLGDANPPYVHLTVPPTFRSTAPGVRLHRAELPDGDVRQQDGFRMTTPLRSLLDVAAETTDVEQLATAIGDALRQGLVTRRQLLARGDAVGPRAALAIERALRQLEEE